MNNQKILIVDDDADLRRALKIRLQANHYETVQASDGYTAVAMAHKERPNLIILDLGLPETATWCSTDCRKRAAWPTFR